jgi:D-xylose transport system substrate-binding protein
MAKGQSIKSDVNAKLDNKKKKVDSVLLPAMVVTKKNLDAALIATGYLKKKDVYKK